MEKYPLPVFVLLKTRKNKLFPLSLHPYGKLKQRILTLAVAMLLLSFLLIDIINVRKASHENAWIVFIKNIHLVVPWGLIYFIAARHRDLLKIFPHLYMSLILAFTACFLPLNLFAESNIETKCEIELVNILNDYATFINNGALSPEKPFQVYSTEEYGHCAPHLNKFKTLIERFKQGERAVVHAVNKIELKKIYSTEVVFNLLNIIEKKKELETLSLLLDETAKKVEDIHSEFVAWGRSLVGMEEVFFQGFATGLCQSSEEKKPLRLNCYRIRKSYIQECIKTLDFLCNNYGNYENVNGRIAFHNENDRQTFSSYLDTLQELAKEEDVDFLAVQERARLITQLYSLMNETNSDPLDQILEALQCGFVDVDQAFAEADIDGIFTEEVCCDLTKIHEKKRQLGQLCPVLDTTQKNLEEQLPKLIQRVLSSTNLSDQVRKKVEIFNETFFAAMKKSFDIKRKYVLEFIKLLDFLSMRYGTYKLQKNHGVCFSYAIENKLCGSYLDNIKKFFKEEAETAFLIQKYTQELSK